MYIHIHTHTHTHLHAKPPSIAHPPAWELSEKYMHSKSDALALGGTVDLAGDGSRRRLGKIGSFRCKICSHVQAAAVSIREKIAKGKLKRKKKQSTTYDFSKNILKKVFQQSLPHERLSSDVESAPRRGLKWEGIPVAAAKTVSTNPQFIHTRANRLPSRRVGRYTFL